MEIESEVVDDILVLAIRESRIDAAGAVAFKEQMRELMENHDGRFLIDMERVEFLDSSGLGALVAVMKMLGSGRRLELANCGLTVRKVLALTKMDKVFVLHEALPGQDAA